MGGVSWMGIRGISALWGVDRRGDPVFAMQKEGKGEGGGKKEADNAITVVLKADLHCDDCAKMVKRAVYKFEGVESVDADDQHSKLFVVGKVDPVNIRDRVERKIHKKVVLISPEPSKENRKPDENLEKEKAEEKPKVEKFVEKPAQENKPSEEKKAEEKKFPEEKNGDKKPKESKKAEEKPKPVVVNTAVLKIRLHCEGCIKKIRRNIYKIKGVEEVVIDAQKHLVSVKGTMDPEALPSILREKFKKNVEIVMLPNKEEMDGEKKEKCGSGEDKKSKEDDGKKGDMKSSEDSGKKGEGMQISEDSGKKGDKNGKNDSKKGDRSSEDNSSTVVDKKISEDNCKISEKKSSEGDCKKGDDGNKGKMKVEAGKKDEKKGDHNTREIKTEVNKMEYFSGGPTTQYYSNGPTVHYHASNSNAPMQYFDPGQADFHASSSNTPMQYYDSGNTHYASRSNAPMQYYVSGNAYYDTSSSNAPMQHYHDGGNVPVQYMPYGYAMEPPSQMFSDENPNACSLM